MTSWIRVLPPIKKKEAVAGGDDESDAAQAKPLFYMTNDDDAPTQFLNFFYTYLYARSAGLPLAVYDRVNPVALTQGLFKDTFYDVSGVQYVDSQLVRAIPIARRATQIAAHVRGLKREDIAEDAQLFFELNEEAGARVRQHLKANGFPREFDVGIVYQAGDAVGAGGAGGRGVNVQGYLAALRGFQARAGLTNLRIFLVSADANFAFELKRLADPAWTIYSLPPTRVAMAVGSAPSQRMRQEAFTQGLAEMVVLQNVPAVIGRMGSSLGKILALTREDINSFLALDGGKWVAL